MVKIKIGKIENKQPLEKPTSMINSEHGTVFQQYFHGKPTKTFYVSCGNAEPSVITIWYDDESRGYKLSTDSIKTLKELNKTVEVKKIKAKVEIGIEI